LKNTSITHVSSAPKVPFNLDGRIMFSSPNVEVIHLILQPGEKIEPHSQPFDVLFFVLEGEGELNYNGETAVFGKDTLIEAKAGVLRGWTNASKENLRLLVIKQLAA
jgi:quercetin dioxygenase-like cupin family protein